MLSDKFLKRYENQEPPWGPLGYPIFLRTYARDIVERSGNERKEEWHETVARVCRGILEVGGVFEPAELEFTYDQIFNMNMLPAGRALWQLGTKTIRKVGADSLNNCWAVCVAHPIEPFLFAFNQLMLGGGVGFNIQAEYVLGLPRIKADVRITHVDDPDCDFIVPDNREGWIELLRKVLEAFYYTGKDLTYSTLLVRRQGTPIKSFGGVASGPGALIEGIEAIAGILRSRVGRKIRPIDAGDIANIIGQIVVSGNVRRSAEILVGDATDQEFLNAKNWKRGPYPNWRSLSNNSIAVDRFADIPDQLWNGYRGDGEPYGLVNFRNCRRFGRVADGLGYRVDRSVRAINPCGEIPLAAPPSGKGAEPCNVCDIILPNVENEEHFIDLAIAEYMICKSITNIKYSHPVTARIVGRNRRIGIGLAGFCQAPEHHNEEMFERVYRAIEDKDISYSKMLGIAHSIKLTTMKPGGTLPLLPRDKRFKECIGIGSGGSRPYAHNCIRRVRMASNDPLVDACREAGYFVEQEIRMDGTYNMNTSVVDFLIRYPEGATEQEVSALEQLETLKWLQTHWADNSVSITVYYNIETEVDSIKAWLEENFDSYIKSVSFLPHSGHGFQQAPLEPISDERYFELLGKVKPIRPVRDAGDFNISGVECANGVCPAK